MTAELETAINRSELLERLVLDSQTTEEIGRISEIALDPKSHRILGLICKSGLLGYNKRLLNWSEIESIGSDSILVKLSDEIKAAKLSSIESMVGHEVWTDTGNCAGKLIDYRFDRETGSVIDYLFVSNGLLGTKNNIYQLPTAAIINVGRKRAIATSSMLENAQLHEASLTQKIQDAANFIKEDYAKTKQNVTTAIKVSQELATGLQEKAQQVVSLAEEKLAARDANKDDLTESEEQTANPTTSSSTESAAPNNK